MKATLAGLILFFLSLSVGSAADENTITGPAQVLDGNTLIVAGQNLRLFGSDAPDLAQSCRFQGRSYACGDVARTALMDLVAGAELRCRLLNKQEDEKTPAPVSCTVQQADLAANMVHTGWALANQQEKPAYAAVEAKARAAKRGLWRGEFIPPAEWRRDK